ncbi:MAG: alpha/beta hydrolase family esterase, partial [Chitinophagales bacterium]
MKKIIVLLALFISTLTYAQVSITDSIFSGGQWRYFRLYVPSIYTGTTAVPLLLNLHGYSSNAFEQEIYGEFRNIADTANFIMVLPEGTTDAFGFQFWNCFLADDIGVDDVQFLSDLIDSVALDYNIDFNRIYSTGMSNGGFMSYTLAGELSERIAAIASVTGSISDERLPAFAPTHPVPVMEIHGTADFTVPYNGSGSFLPVEDVIDYWVGIN